MGRVFVVQEPLRRNRITGELERVFDLRPASAFGELEFLLPAGPLMLNPQPTILKLRHKLRNFNDEDYLLPVGDPVAMISVAGIAAQNNNGQLALLRWDNRQHNYQAIKVNLYGQEYVKKSVLNNRGIHDRVT